MKHGDSLCFVTRIVEKSWKNRGKFLSSEKPPFQLRPRVGSVENSVPVRLPPGLTFPYPAPAMAFEVRDKASSRCFRSFSTIFPRSEAKNCILTAIVELKYLSAAAISELHWRTIGEKEQHSRSFVSKCCSGSVKSKVFRYQSWVGVRFNQLPATSDRRALCVLLSSTTCSGTSVSAHVSDDD